MPNGWRETSLQLYYNYCSLYNLLVCSNMVFIKLLFCLEKWKQMTLEMNVFNYKGMNIWNTSYTCSQ